MFLYVEAFRCWIGGLDVFWAGDFHGCLVGSLNFRGQASGANPWAGWWGKMPKRHTPLKINMSPKKGTISSRKYSSNQHFGGDMLVFGGVGLFRK